MGQFGRQFAASPPTVTGVVLMSRGPVSCFTSLSIFPRPKLDQRGTDQDVRDKQEKEQKRDGYGRGARENTCDGSAFVALLPETPSNEERREKSKRGEECESDTVTPPIVQHPSISIALNEIAN